MTDPIGNPRLAALHQVVGIQGERREGRKATAEANREKDTHDLRRVPLESKRFNEHVDEERSDDR